MGGDDASIEFIWVFLPPSSWNEDRNRKAFCFFIGRNFLLVVAIYIGNNLCNDFLVNFYFLSDLSPSYVVNLRVSTLKPFYSEFSQISSSTLTSELLRFYIVSPSIAPPSVIAPVSSVTSIERRRESNSFLRSVEGSIVLRIGILFNFLSVLDCRLNIDENYIAGKPELAVEFSSVGSSFTDLFFFIFLYQSWLVDTFSDGLVKAGSSPKDLLLFMT